MSLKIHLFIATNKGLVALQDLMDLNDSTLQSVITIKGSTDLANISPAYHRFVQKNTGLIQNEFGGSSFRTNISRNIDQGNSWQLAFYIAHFIDSFSDSSFHLGDGSVKAGDIALIATGQINTSNGVIEAVDQIPEKYITASAQIKLWMKKGILVEFFIPAANLSRQLPELDCAVYPMLNTQQIREHVELLLPLPVLSDVDTMTEGRFYRNSKGAQSIEIVNGVVEEVSSKATQKTPAFTSLQHDSKNQPNAHYFSSLRAIVADMSTANIAVLVICFLALISLLYFSSVQLTKNNHASGPRFVVTKKNNAYCDANAISQLTAISGQYVSRMPSIAMPDACSITLITSDKMPQVWLVADTKTLIELEHKLIMGEAHWTIPIPNQQEINREYILILAYERLDLADLAAFKSMLSRISRTQKPSVELLSEFFTQIGVNPQYVSQKLLVNEER